MEQDNVAERLRDKIGQLISRYEAALEENVRLSSELETCRSQLENNRLKIEKLEKQLGSLQLKEAFTGAAGDRVKARRRVASLIKEIDECIGMLNG